MFNLYGQLYYDSNTGILYRKLRNGELKQQVNPKSGYKMTRFGDTLISLHRLIMWYFYGPIPSHYVIDHIDGNSLNNKLRNLRFATKKTNQYNKHILGATWEEKRQKWKVSITHNYKRIFIGRFKTLREAQKAYVEASKDIQGEFLRDTFGIRH